MSCARLSRARDELAVSRGQRSMRFEHFTVFADADVGQELAARWRARTWRPRTRSRRRSSAGRSPRRSSWSCTRAGRTFRSCRFPTGSRGSTTGRSACRWRPKPSRRAPRGRCSRTSSRTRSSARARGDHAPAWFHEGLAQWCEGRRIPVRDVRGGRRAASGADLRRARRGLRAGPARAAAVRATYAQALSLVEYLVAVRGRGRDHLHPGAARGGRRLVRRGAARGDRPLRKGDSSRAGGGGRGSELLGDCSREEPDPGRVGRDRQVGRIGAEHGPVELALAFERPQRRDGRRRVARRGRRCGPRARPSSSSRRRGPAPSAIVATAAAVSPRPVSTTASVASVSGSGPGFAQVPLQQGARVGQAAVRQRRGRELAAGSRRRRNFRERALEVLRAPRTRRRARGRRVPSGSRSARPAAPGRDRLVPLGAGGLRPAVLLSGEGELLRLSPGLRGRLSTRAYGSESARWTASAPSTRKSSAGTAAVSQRTPALLGREPAREDEGDPEDREEADERAAARGRGPAAPRRAGARARGRAGARPRRPARCRDRRGRCPRSSVRAACGRRSSAS